MLWIIPHCWRADTGMWWQAPPLSQALPSHMPLHAVSQQILAPPVPLYLVTQFPDMHSDPELHPSP